MFLFKNGNKYYLSKNTNKYYGWDGNTYVIKDGRLVWANPNIYLHFDGNSWIDTEFKPNQDTKVEIIYSPEQSSKQYECLFGSRNSSSPYNNFQVFISPFNYSYSTGRFDYGNGTSNFSYTTEIGKKYKVVADKNQLYINNTLVSTRTYGEFQGNYNIVIGGSNVGGTVESTKSIKKYYSSKLYDNNKLIRNYVPVPKGLLIGDFIVPSNGMFDIIEQKFYPNQGTGNFEIGGISEDYIIDNGRLIWCDDNIYLKCNGAQYFDSGFKANQDTKIEVDYTSNGSGTQALYCSRVNTSTATFTMFRPIGNITRFDYNTSQNNISGTVSSGTRYIVIADKNKCYIDNELKYTATYANFQSNMGMIFGCSGYGGGHLDNWGYHKYHKIQLYDNSKLVHYFLPVNTNTVIGNFTVPAPGMWDAVTKKFYPNKGTGAFTYGKDN